MQSTWSSVVGQAGHHLGGRGRVQRQPGVQPGRAHRLERVVHVRRGLPVDDDRVRARRSRSPRSAAPGAPPSGARPGPRRGRARAPGARPTIRAPIEIGGTKWPSITSTWITRAPASMTDSTWSPRRAKSAARIDGATRTSCEERGGHGGATGTTPPSTRGCVLRAGLYPVLRPVLHLVERGHLAAVHVLAVVVDRRRTGPPARGRDPRRSATRSTSPSRTRKRSRPRRRSARRRSGSPIAATSKRDERPEPVAAVAAVRVVAAAVGEDEVRRAPRRSSVSSPRPPEMKSCAARRRSRVVVRRGRRARWSRSRRPPSTVSAAARRHGRGRRAASAFTVSSPARARISRARRCR